MSCRHCADMTYSLAIQADEFDELRTCKPTNFLTVSKKNRDSLLTYLTVVLLKLTAELKIINFLSPPVVFTQYCFCHCGAFINVHTRLSLILRLVVSWLLVTPCAHIKIVYHFVSYFY